MRFFPSIRYMFHEHVGYTSTLHTSPLIYRALTLRHQYLRSGLRKQQERPYNGKVRNEDYLAVAVTLASFRRIVFYGGGSANVYRSRGFSKRHEDARSSSGERTAANRASIRERATLRINFTACTRTHGRDLASAFYFYYAFTARRTIRDLRSHRLRLSRYRAPIHTHTHTRL